MKALKKASLALLFLSIISCSNNDSDENNTDNTNLYKKVTFNTQSSNPESNTKNVKYYSNNEVIADTTFNHLNQWTHRRVITTVGTTKSYQTFDTGGQLIAHREETFDSQGRVTSRRTYLPLNLIKVAFTYNADNTVTANAIDVTDQSVEYIATYHKNADGLIYKEFKPMTIAPYTIIENTVLFDGLKPISSSSIPAGTPITFDYYTNPMPSDLLKSIDKLNNDVLLGLSLSKLAEEGNFYYKRNDSNSNGTTSTYQTDFNTNNYIQYYKSTYLNNTSNNLLTTEVFYYYN